MNIDVNYGKAIKIGLVHNDMTQQDLADKLKISRRWLSKVCTNQHKPSLPILERIAGAFNMPLSEFIAWGE